MVALSTLSYSLSLITTPTNPGRTTVEVIDCTYHVESRANVRRRTWHFYGDHDYLWNQRTRQRLVVWVLKISIRLCAWKSVPGMHLSNGQVGAGSNLALCIYSRTHIDHIHTLVRYNRISIHAELQWSWIEYGDKFTVPVNFQFIFSQCHIVPYFSVRTLDIEDSLPPAAGKADQCFFWYQGSYNRKPPMVPDA